MSARRFWSWGPVFAGLSAGNSTKPAPASRPATVDETLVPMGDRAMFRGHRCTSEHGLASGGRPPRLPVHVSDSTRGIPVLVTEGTPTTPSSPPVRMLRGLPYLLVEAEEGPIPVETVRRRQFPRATVRESEWQSLMRVITSGDAPIAKGGAA